jgi:hypothetical protein
VRRAAHQHSAGVVRSLCPVTRAGTFAPENLLTFLALVEAATARAKAYRTAIEEGPSVSDGGWRNETGTGVAELLRRGPALSSLVPAVRIDTVQRPGASEAG